MKLLAYKSNINDSGLYRINTKSDKVVLNNFIHQKRLSNFVLIPSQVKPGQYQIRTAHGSIYDINVKAV